MVSDATGFQVFIRGDKNKKLRRPDVALRTKSEPAIMAYGNALEMFSPPDAPFAVINPEAKSATKDSLSKALEDCNLQGRAVTEHELRLQGDKAPTTPDPPPPEQWVSLERNIDDAAALMHEYNKRTLEMSAAFQKTKSRSADATASDAIAPDATKMASPWPAVGQRDFAGSTNWVHVCVAVDKKKFERALDDWASARARRSKAIRSALKNWKPSKDFEDCSTQYGSPTKFYKGGFLV